MNTVSTSDIERTMSFKPFLAYSASAGSGKTFALSVRYISLLFMGESASTILAATFTNKAAAEMRQRVVDSLRALDAGRNRAFADAICTETGLSREVLLAKQPEVLDRFLAGAAYIVTLDGFFSSILHSASLELGLEPDFVSREEGDEKLEAYFLEELQAEGLLSSLARLAMDIEDRRFEKIFALMQDFYRVDPLLPEVDDLSLSLAEEEKKIDEIRLKMIKALMDAGAAERAVKQFETESVKVLFGKSLFEKERLGEHSWYRKSINEEIESVYAELKEALGLWARARESAVLQNLFRIYDYYRNANISNAKRSGILSFDDLSYFSYRLLHESISKEFLYFKIDSKFRHILLDEFQDTSTLQFLLLKPLIDEIFAGEGQSDFKTFFYVGDTKQSLYRFRGGVEALFERVAERYGVKIEEMDTNYRSSRLVVEQVNLWFESVMEGYVPQKSREGAKEGYVKVMESEALIEDAVAEAKRVLSLGIDIDDIAFLVSTNKDGRLLQEACEYEGIDTLLKTSSSLKSIPKIAALVAMVSYLFYGERIDAEALLAKVGKTTDEVDLSRFSLFGSPADILDRLIREFGYFDNDLNLLKLLEYASGFDDIPTFLKEFGRSSLSLAANSVHGAKIMTIHGSKGLEFEYVIVLDRLGRAKPDTSALIYRYDEKLYIDKIFYRSKGREHFDADYAAVLKEKKASSLKDRKNVLYVALTRAVNGLIVLKRPANSLFDGLNLSPTELGSVSAKAADSRISDREVSAASAAISHYGTQKTPEREEEERDFEAILFGTALHYTLEMLGRFDAESVATAVNAMQNSYGQLLNSRQMEEIERRVRMLVETERFQDMLSGATLSREQSLSYEGSLRQIDLLLDYGDRTMVIDYKSSRKYAARHRNQVRYYQKAIESITARPSSGTLVYLLEEGIEIQSLN